MTTITANYEGELRCEAVHLRSGNTLLTDAPVDNNGKGEAFSPTDLTATSLLTCVLTVMGIQAKKMRKAFNASGEVHKHMVPDPRRIGALEVFIRAKKADFTPQQIELLEQVGRDCPVALSLHPETRQEYRFEWS